MHDMYIFVMNKVVCIQFQVKKLLIGSHKWVDSDDFIFFSLPVLPVVQERKKKK